MGFFARLFGVSNTKPPRQPDCWTWADGAVEVNLHLARELAEPGGAVRLEGGQLPLRLLVFRDGDGEYHVFENKCSHAGRRLDPLPGQARVQCCSVGKSIFDYAGQRISGSAKTGVRTFPLVNTGEKLIIDVSGEP